MKSINKLTTTEKLKQIKGDLITVDLEVEGLNMQFHTDYDGFIMTPQNSRTVKSFLYGFYGLPTDNTNAYYVHTFWR